MKIDDIARRLVWLSAAGLLALPAIATADHHANLEIEAEVALEVDILIALDLPLVAHEAREAGIEDEQIEIALTSAMNGGLSAASAAEIVAVEVEETRKEGKAKENFGQWVRRQVSDGATGRELAQKIRERKAELDELSEEEDEQLASKLEELREQRKAYRAQLREKRKELRADGKKITLRGKEEHEVRKQALVAARAELLEAGRSLRTGGHGLVRAKANPGRPGVDAEDAVDERSETDAEDDETRGKSDDARADAAKSKADAKADAAKAKADAAKSKADAKADAAKSKADAAKSKADAKADAAKAKTDGKAAAKGKADTKGSAASSKGNE